MKRFAIIVLLLVACAQEKPAPEAPPPIPTSTTNDTAERENLLEMLHGATVTDRTGEVLLDFSVLRVVDSDPGSFWTNPPGDLPQSFTIALPARSRIDKVGFRTVPHGGYTAGHVMFESSLDGRKFTPVITVKSADTDNAQWFDVKPFEATSVRVTAIDAFLPKHDLRLNSALAHGSEVEPPHPGDIAGCWSVNGESARFDREGKHVTGVLRTGKQPIYFEGGSDGRAIRLNWIRGNDYGMSLLTVSPDGQHLNGLNWHEEAIPMFFDTSWFGERQPCVGPAPAAFDVPSAVLKRTGRYSLYDTSELPRLSLLPNVQFVSHEFRFATPEENHRAAQQALDRLHLKGIAEGSDHPRQQPVTGVMRALYSAVDVEIRR